MSDPNSTIVEANQEINAGITSQQSGDTASANQHFEQAATLYDQAGDSGNAQDARDLITPA